MAAASSAPSPVLCRFLLQLVGILLEDIVTKRLRVEVSEQQHTFYCQELGTLLMCLIHIFKSGRSSHSPVHPGCASQGGGTVLPRASPAMLSGYLKILCG